jgi:transcriptional regulator with XRE-family HTH domain
MPEIGAMLREARMRERIDISEIEAQTKIRAKYLRALENEEWDLLPGPTYVKTFLRTYAEALGIDGRLLVEEYKLNHERPSELELQPIMPSASRDRDRRRGARPRLPRGMTAILVVVGLLVVVAILGIIGGGSSPTKPQPNRVATPGQKSSPSAAPGATGPAAAVPTSVSLQLIPTGVVYVCMVGTHGNKILNGVTLSPGTTQPVYHGRRFVVTFGNGFVRMRVNGKLRNVPDVSNPITYVVTPRGRHTLPPAQAPSCG